LDQNTAKFFAQQEYKYDARVLRGLYLFVVRVLSGSHDSDKFQFHAFFCTLLRQELCRIKKQKMAFTKKNIAYADLIVPFIKCPLGEAVADCPFKDYWKMDNEDKQIDLVDQLPEEKLDELRAFHRECLKVKIQAARENTTRIHENF